MHGYFLSLKLYTTARLIANPQSYEEYRDKLVSEKIASKAESRIRARREQPKVNKALAERLRRAEEREEAAARKKAARAAARGDGATAEEVGEAKSKDKVPSLMSDPRFKDIFENPEFEVDEQSREFALLNPATADNNAVKRAAAAATGRTRTAVESEDEDGGASDSFDEESEEDDEDDEDEDVEAEAEDAAQDDESESGDSDDGGTFICHTCHIRRPEPRSTRLTCRLGSIRRPYLSRQSTRTSPA